jgi:hypothetical protein
MAAAKKVRATRRFVVFTDDGYRVVQDGELRAATDEVVKANPSLFEPAVEAAKDREKRGAS